MSALCDNQFDTSNASILPDGNEDELLLTSHSNPTQCAAKRLIEDGTIVTKNDDDDSDEFDSAPEDGEHQFQQEEEDEYDHSEFESHVVNVPAEVKVSFNENDNDNNSCDDHDSDDESDCESEEDELDDDADEEESEEDNDADEEDSTASYETDEDSVESERSNDHDLMDDTMSCCSTASSRSNTRRLSDASQHELFLPWDVSPSTESLKYGEDDDSSDEEEDRRVPHYFHRTYMIGNNRNSGRPRMWDGCPSGVSVSSDSSSSDGSECAPKKRKADDAAASKAGVSFNHSVIVHPVFETSAYSSSQISSMYTKRDELRTNKMRNKREFAYDLGDWRTATEEDEMECNDVGELVHPVHCAAEKKKSSPPPCRKVVQTYSSALGGYTTVGVAHRAKRMRMYYP